VGGDLEGRACAVVANAACREYADGGIDDADPEARRVRGVLAAGLLCGVSIKKGVSANEDEG